MSLAHKGMVFTAEHRKNLSIALRGRTYSEETRRKMSLAKKGMPSPNKGKKASPETIARLVASHMGIGHTEETRAKMRETHKRVNSVARLWKGPRWNKGRKGLFRHSIETRKKISAAGMGRKNPNPVKGDKHYNWKGGVTPEHLKIRNSFAYKVWRNAVFSRDNWICQKYKTKGGVMRAHHIQSFSKHPELRLVVDNGVTLSDRAHKEFHVKYGRHNNTAHQLIEFLSTP